MAKIVWGIFVGNDWRIDRCVSYRFANGDGIFGNLEQVLGNAFRYILAGKYDESLVWAYAMRP